MGKKKIKRVVLNNCSDKIVFVDGEYFKYSAGDAYVHVKYDIIDQYPSILDVYKGKGFTKLDNINDGEDEINIENVERCKKYDHVDFVTFIHNLNPSDVTNFFSYQITIQLCGKHIKSFYPLADIVTTIDENIITFITYEDNEQGIYGKYGPEADALFGPKYPSKNACLSDDGRYPYEYRRPITDIEKIFLTKKYRDVEVIGTDHDYLYNGKVEVLELDLINPDMEIYERMRAIDNCIEIEWEDFNL